MNLYWFFLSYARRDAVENNHVEQFYRDLALAVGRSAGTPSDVVIERIGFFDQTGINVGDTWPDALADALKSSRILICLYSPGYFNSEYCGKELQVFLMRIADYRDTLPPNERPPRLILPVLWVKPGLLPDPLPHAVRNLQYAHSDLGQAYLEWGLEHLIKINRHQDDYQAFVTELARSIVTEARAHRLPPLRELLPIEVIENAFDSRGTRRITTAPIRPIFSIFFFVAALAAAIIVSYRLEYPAPDLLSFSILTLLWFGLIFAGSLFFPLGRRWVRSANRRVMIHFISLLAVCALFQALPYIALRYNNKVFQRNEVGEKIKLLTRAVALDPEHAEAHYNLAAIFEDLPDQEKAILEYRAAVRADPRFYQAHNNLARLLIHRGEYGDALDVINSAFKQNPGESSVRYTLFKNRGWAHLGLKLYEQASNDLKEAIEVDNTRAAAHCLRAQLLEARKNFSASLIEWNFCLEFWLEDEKGLESAWRSTAQERLKSGGPQ